MSHSKRNTSLAFFTSHERSLLKTAWGSQRTRLSRDSFLPFGSCSLCLEPSRDPVACPKGDMFCRECAVSNLLQQRQEIKRLEKEGERKKEDEREREVLDEEEARERAVREFEMVQMGLSAKGAGSGKIVGRQGGRITVEEEVESTSGAPKNGTKRKFELDEEELLRIAQEERRKMRKEIDAEKEASRKHLPSFWVPAETPSATANTSTTTHINSTNSSNITQQTPTKLTPLCPSSTESSPHPLSLKTLTPINFTEEASTTGSKALLRTCPACRKALSNGSKAVLAVPCGHVLCQPCVGKFMTPAKPDPHDPDAGKAEGVRCYVCEADLSGKVEASGREKKKGKRDREGVRSGLVELRSDGTGFAGGGTNVVKKEGVAFQC